MEFPLRYRAKTKEIRVFGCGRTKLVGSQEVVFVTDQPLPDGAKVEIGIAWPFLLEGRARLQLVMDARVTRTEGKLAEARIQKYHFKTRGDWSEAGEAGPTAAALSQAGARGTLVAFRT